MDDQPLNELSAARILAQAVGLETDPITTTVTGSLDTWRGPFRLDEIAVSAVGVATSAAAQLLAQRTGSVAPPVTIEARHAAAAFQSELLVEPQGWAMPPVWDPIAGDYEASDGWVRLHTNYRSHRRAALTALGFDPDDAAVDRTRVAAEVAGWSAEDVEQAVVAAAGVAARQRTPEQWSAHPAAPAADEPLLERTTTDGSARPLPPADRPFDGVRVLDLTRVLAGPTTTGFLAAWGADVLRIDPPGFEEVPAIVPISTAGKRLAALDLRRAEDRDRFLDLVAGADVVVHGYRPGALHDLGLDPAQWATIRPGLVVASLGAYGAAGTWRHRRGFDSIVQHSAGITSIGQTATGSPRPVAMPCQALDHGCGWLLAAAVATGLIHRCRTGQGTTVTTSLSRFAELVKSLPADVDPDRVPPALTDLASFTVTAETAWGPLRRLAWPGRIGRLRPTMGTAGPLGTHAPAWT